MIGSSTFPGATWHESTPLFPEATMTVMPYSIIRFLTASSRALDQEPTPMPRDMVTIAGFL